MWRILLPEGKKQNKTNRTKPLTALSLRQTISQPKLKVREAFPHSFFLHLTQTADQEQGRAPCRPLLACLRRLLSPAATRTPRGGGFVPPPCPTGWGFWDSRGSFRCCCPSAQRRQARARPLCLHRERGTAEVLFSATSFRGPRTGHHATRCARLIYLGCVRARPCACAVPVRRTLLGT